MLARTLADASIRIEDAASDKYFSYIPGTPTGILRGDDRFAAELIDSMRAYKLKGAEILYESSVPDFIPRKETFACALVRSLDKLNSLELDTLAAAEICAMGKNPNPYISMLESRKGYAVLTGGTAPKRLPLPLSGYKIISAYCTGRARGVERDKRIKSAMRSIERIYPHVGSIADVTREMADNARIKDKSALKYMYHLADENKRLKETEAALKRCDIKTLFYNMNMSQKSMEKYWDTDSEYISLARIAASVEGAMASRCGDSGVVIIAEEDKVNYIMGIVGNEFEVNIGYKPTFCISDPF